MRETGDIRIDAIMPRLCDDWPVIPFEESLAPSNASYKKLRSSDIRPSGPIPVVDQGEAFISGYTDDPANAYPGALPVIVFGDHTRRFKFVDFRFAVGAQGTHLLRPRADLAPEFFYHYLSSLNLESQGYSRHYKFLKQVAVPVPPLAEQRRIAAKLGNLLSRVDADRRRLAKVPFLLRRFRQSVLAAACSGHLTADWREERPGGEDAAAIVALLEKMHDDAGGHKKGNAAPPSDEAHDLSADDMPPTWRLTEMRTVVRPDRPITYGILKPGPDTPGGIPYVRVADFPNDRLKRDTIRRTTKEIDKTFARARLRPGDILLSIRGTVGRVCVVPPELEGANITQDTARLSVQSALDVAFVTWFLRAAPTQERIQKAVKGVAVRGINIGDVRALQMPVPPLAEQHEIVRRVDALFALADQIEARFTQARAQVDRLTPSLLAKAFRGELVPQDPADEPAAALLARINGGGSPSPSTGKRSK
jgi:type I restriction enzyme, S subunit